MRFAWLILFVACAHLSHGDPCKGVVGRPTQMGFRKGYICQCSPRAVDEVEIQVCDFPNEMT